MKQILAILVGICFSAAMLSAQDQSYFYNTGFDLEWSMGGHMFGEAAAETTVGAGYRFGQGWMMSVGAGYTGSTFPNEGKWNNFITAYIEGKYSFLDRKVSPYLGVRVKGQYMLDPDMGKLFVHPDYDRYTSSKQLFVLPQVGVDIKKTSIWIGFGPHFAWEIEHDDADYTQNPSNNPSVDMTPSKDIDRKYLIPCQSSSVSLLVPSSDISMISSSTSRNFSTNLSSIF